MESKVDRLSQQVSPEFTAVRGAGKSAAKRRAATDAVIERIRLDWGKPSVEHSTDSLLKRTSAPGRPLSYNTVKSRLGGRELAQARYQAALADAKRAGR